RRHTRFSRDWSSDVCSSDLFPTPEHVVAAAAEAVNDPKNHHYTAAAGLAELREAVAADAGRYSGVDVAPNQVVITNGGKQAVYRSEERRVGKGRRRRRARAP